MEVSQGWSRVRRSYVPAALVGIIIYSAFYLIEMGMFTHPKITNFINSESSVALKVKHNQNDVILESDFINISSSYEIEMISTSFNVGDFCGECWHSQEIGICQRRVDVLTFLNGDSDTAAKLAVLQEQPINCNLRSLLIPDQFTIDSTNGMVVAVKIDETYAFWEDGSQRLCSLLRKITNVTALGLPSEPPLFLRTSTPAPLINFTMNCVNASTSTGNWFYALYMVQLQAALARVNLQFQCLEGSFHKRDQILPWFSGFYNLSGDPNDLNWWPFDLDRPDDYSLCGAHPYRVALPLHFATHIIQRDMRRFALKQLGPRQDLPFYLNLSALDLPPGLIPMYPNEEVDDVAIHFRCGDILGVYTGPGYGIIKFDEYKRRIFPEARTIGILTQPFDPDLLRLQDRSKAQDCKRIVFLLVEYLSKSFPNSTVTIRNSSNDTLPLTWARLIMANQTIISISTFGIFPGIGTFGQGYFQRGDGRLNGFNVHIPDILSNTHLMDSPVLTGVTARKIGIDEIAKWVVEPTDTVSSITSQAAISPSSPISYGSIQFDTVSPVVSSINKSDSTSFLCAANPYIKSLSSSLSDIAVQAKEWLGHMDTHLTEARKPEMLGHSHARFFPFQVMSDCKHSCVGGRCGEDTSKIVCGMEQLRSQKENKCVVYSIGGNNQWEFEVDVLGSTLCEVHTFDCTGSKSRFQKPEDDRLAFHHICIGAASQPAPKFADNCTEGICGPIMTLQEIQKMLGHDQIDLFKMDIEGYEWPIFESWPELSDNDTDSSGIFLPMQMMVEIHYKTQFPDLFRPDQTRWWQDYKLPDDVVRLQAHMLRMGYAVVVRDDNEACLHCTELTLIRFKC